MTRIVRNYLVIVLGILFMGGIGLSYVGRSARDVLFMDYWRYINDILPSVLNGSLDRGTMAGRFWTKKFPYKIIVGFEYKIFEI